MNPDFHKRSDNFAFRAWPRAWKSASARRAATGSITRSSWS